jgi:hypothetical protein
MRGPAQALLWQLWRQSRWEVPLRTLVVLWLYAMFAAAPAYLSPSTLHLLGPETPTLFAFAVMIVAALLSRSWLGCLETTSDPCPLRLDFTRPVSTPLLVALPMTYIACNAGISYLVPATILRFAFDVPLPLLSVAAVVAVACTGLVMATWSPKWFFARMLGISAMAVFCAVGVLYAAVHFGNESLRANPRVLIDEWTLSAGHYVALLALFALFVGVTTSAVHRQRHGDRIEFAWLTCLYRQMTRGLSAWRCPVRSPFAAQFWFEVRRFGVPMVLPCLLLAVLTLVNQAVLYLSMEEPWSTFVITTLSFVLLSMCAGMVTILIGLAVMAGLKGRPGHASLPGFDTTQAMSCGGLILSKVCAFTASLFVSVLIMSPFGGAWWMALEAPDPASIGIPATTLGSSSAVLLAVSGAYVVTVLCAAACAILLAMQLAVARYKATIHVSGVIGFGYVALNFAAGERGWNLTSFWHAHAWLLAVALPLLTVWALHRAASRRHITKQSVIVAFLLWLAFLASAAVLYLKIAPALIPDDFSIAVSAQALSVASLVIPLASVALAPLALACHRHQ